MSKTSADIKEGVADCLSRLTGKARLNHANMVSFRFIGGNRMTFVSGIVVKGLRLLSPSQHLGRMDLGT
jgi:hypothetical protein